VIGRSGDLKKVARRESQVARKKYDVQIWRATDDVRRTTRF